MEWFIFFFHQNCSNQENILRWNSRPIEYRKTSQIQYEAIKSPKPERKIHVIHSKTAVFCLSLYILSMKRNWTDSYVFMCYWNEYFMVRGFCLYTYSIKMICVAIWFRHFYLVNFTEICTAIETWMMVWKIDLWRRITEGDVHF